MTARLILAAVDFSSVARSARAPRLGAASWLIGIILAAVIGLWIAVVFWDRHRRRLVSEAGSPRALFLQLCQTHGLDRNERLLLWQAAARHRLEQPALVFVLPNLLGELASDSAGGSEAETEAYARLARKLFGTVAIPGGTP